MGERGQAHIVQCRDQHACRKPSGFVRIVVLNLLALGADVMY